METNEEGSSKVLEIVSRPSIAPREHANEVCDGGRKEPL
jgi:hypothetical protein